MQTVPMTAALLLAAGTVLGADQVSQPTILDAGRVQAADGRWFTYTKSTVEGADRVVLSDGTRTLTHAEFRAENELNTPAVIEPALASIAEEEPARKVFVSIQLRERPAGPIARELRAREAESRAAIDAEIRAIRSVGRPQASMSPAEEAAWLRAPVHAPLNAVERARVDQLAQRAEELGRQTRDELVRRTKLLTNAQTDAVCAAVEALGGSITGVAILSSTIEARLPAGQIDKLVTRDDIVRINHQPPATLDLDNHRESLGVAPFYDNGIDGGIWDAGVIDSGVQQDHPLFSDQTFQDATGTGVDTNGHGTGVAGIIANNSLSVPGIAYGTDSLLVGSSSAGSRITHADWMVSGAADDAEVINMSWNIGRANVNDYDTVDMFYDGIVDDFDAMVIKSASNLGDGTTTLGRPASAYNPMTVANISDLDTVSRSDDIIDPTSSRGPTLAGRKKPDISAPGTNTMSLEDDWSMLPIDLFDSIGGTSAAAPHVAAGAILLTDLRANDFNMLFTKAVLINTAETWSDRGTTDTLDDGSGTGSEWNKIYGWGYMHLGQAYFNGLDYFNGTVPDTGRDFKLYRGVMFQNEKATLTWNRHIAYDGTVGGSVAEDLSDLDLYMYDESDHEFSEDSSQSYIDNVEQVAATTFGSKVLRVDAFGSFDPDIGDESFCLATEENFIEVQGPDLVVEITPLDVSPNTDFTIRATVTNAGDLNAFDVDVTLDIGADYGGVQLANIPALIVGESVELLFELDGNCDANGVNPFTVSATCLNWGKRFDSNLPVEYVIPTTTPLVSDDPMTFTTVPATYDFHVPDGVWTVCGLRPATANDVDLAGDDDRCVDSPFEVSQYTDRIDFVVVNGDHPDVRPQDDFFAQARNASDGTAYDLEYEAAVDLAIGNSTTIGFGPDQLVDVYQAVCYEGIPYEFRVSPALGFADVAIYVYNGQRDTGERSDANHSADAGGQQAAETIAFTPSETGLYGFVVARQNDSGNAAYSIRLSSTCACDSDQNGTVDVLDLLAYLDGWFDGGQILDLLDFLTCWFPASVGDGC